MSLEYFENAIDSGYLQEPNDYFRDLQQEAINGLFDCTTAKFTIQEQDYIGSPSYHNIDVWLDYVVGTTSSGVKNGIDFTKVMFRDIEHPTIQGLYYKFDNNYHISYFYNLYDGVEKTIAVRKCNNAMKIVDPENGGIFIIPCVVDYDMTSPSQQVSSYVITPNNHASVMVQGNPDTQRLFKLNTRYMFNGRPFKLLAYQNALYHDLDLQQPTLLYLDLYLDELHDKDDIENQLAYNGTYDYTLSLNAENMDLMHNNSGRLSTTILLNGEEVDRPVEWETSDENVIKVAINGGYLVTGNNNDQATITAKLKGNNKVFDSIKINVVDNQSIAVKSILNPAFSQIRQFETIPFEVQVFYGSELIDNVTVNVSLSLDDEVLSNDYLIISKVENQYQLTANKIADDSQYLYITVETEDGNRTTESIAIDIVSMFG